jgi:hypothetical protein
MDTKDLFAPMDPMRQEDGTSFVSITNPDGDPSQVKMKSRTERPREDDSKIKILLLQRLGEV